MKLKKNILILGLLLGIGFAPSSFGYSGEIKPVSTLKEIQKDISSLEKEKIRLEFKWETFLIGNEKLGDMIKTNLTIDEKRALESHVVSYSHSKSALEESLVTLLGKPEDIQKTQKELLILKQEFYMLLVSYIEVSKLSDFKKYVTGELTFYEKSKDVGIEITQKNLEKNERVLELEEKVIQNSQVLRNQIEIKMTQQVKQKLDVFIEDSKFKSLTAEQKILIFQRMIDKIIIKLGELEQTPNATTIIDEKVFLYNILIQILESYINIWK